MGPSADVEKFRQVFAKAKRIVVLAGPGASEAHNGHLNPNELFWQSLDATPEAFALNPSLVWQMYHRRRLHAITSKPTPLHILLAKLSIKSFRKSVGAENAKHYHLITQNVDRLSLAALNTLLVENSSSEKKKSDDDKPKRSSLVQMNGNVLEVRCMECGWCEEDSRTVLCPAFEENASHHSGNPGGIAGMRDIPQEELPKCPKCHALARPGAVFAGERLLDLETIDHKVKKADLCIILGTSFGMHPASTYIDRVQKEKGKVAVFTLRPTHSDKDADFLFPGPCAHEFLRVIGSPADSHEMVVDEHVPMPVPLIPVH